MLLAIETSCDETSVAIVQHGAVKCNLVSSQTRLHAEYGGVVPELATREHLRNLAPLVREALRQTGAGADAVEAVAATRGPGLPSALLVGWRAAQALAFAWDRPFIGIHHHEAHLYSPWIRSQPLRADFDSLAPHVSLIVSGGHTMLVRVDAEFRHRVLGSTVDDAAGECFDKTAKLLGLAYPGGPWMDRLAEGGDPKAFAFPRPMLAEWHDDFSFSGLKTSVRYRLRDHPEVLTDESRLRDFCASVQAAIVEVLVGKTIRAARRAGVRCVTASGGVTCNRQLRRDLTAACHAEGFHLRLAEPLLCTDNAAMVGIVAERQFARGLPLTDLDEEIRPSWALTDLER